MFKFIFVFSITLLSAHLFAQQQTIKSTGDHNTNANMKGLVNIVVSGSPQTRAALRSAAKTELGDDTLWQSLLLPASDQLPESCIKTRIDTGKLTTAPPKTILRVVAGTNEFNCTHLPCNIVRTDKNELLAIDGKPGAITIEAKIRDKNGDIIVSVEKSEFYVNRNLTYRPPVRDKSSLKVFDMKGNTVLEIRYANRHTLLVQQAIFDTGADGTMTIDPKHIQIVVSGREGHHYLQKMSGECDVQTDDDGHSGYFAEQLGNFFFGGSPK